MEPTYSVRQARAAITDILNRAEAGDSTVITRNGRPVAAVVPIDDYDALERAEDEVLAREATRILAQEGDGPRHALAEVLADIFGEPAA